MPLIFIALLIALLPTGARAQDTATSFEQLRPLLTPGEIVEVDQADGRRVKVRVVQLSADAIEVQDVEARTGGSDSMPARCRLLEADVQQVVLERRDSLWNGTLIGLGAAALPGLMTIAYGLDASDDGYTTGADVAGAGLVMLGIGTGSVRSSTPRFGIDRPCSIVPRVCERRFSLPIASGTAC